MIYDLVENLDKYKGIHKNLDKAIDYIKSCDFSTLKSGKNVVDNTLFYIRSEMYGKKETELDFEFHKKYADIQMVVEGKEYFEQIPFRSATKEETTIPYDETIDKGYVRLNHFNKVLMSNDVFVLVLPYEYHKSELAFDDKLITKLTWKVLID